MASDSNYFDIKSPSSLKITNWMLKNNINQIRLRHIVNYKGRDKHILEDYIPEKVPPTVSPETAIHILSYLIRKGLATSYVGETKFEYFEFQYDGDKEKEWKYIIKKRNLINYIKMAFFGV